MSAQDIHNSSLPPRKRARTQEEKEQRRVERILRNRRAAHASREKKRKHVEHLESHVGDLEKVVDGYKQRDSLLLAIQSQLLEKVKSLGGDVSDISLDIPELEVVPQPKRQKLFSEDEFSDAEIKEEPEMVNSTKQEQDSKDYLSPPTSHFDSTSPSNFTLDVKEDLAEEYMMNPLFLPNEEMHDSTNLQITHEPSLWDSEEKTNELEGFSGFNRLHHPAAMSVWRGVA